jgi:transposase
MPRYVGLDLHKELIEACFIDEQGKHLHRCRVAVTRESIEMFAAKWLQPSDQVVMEATTNTWEVAELIRPRVAKVAIANPLKVKVIAEAKTKTDKVDAEVLAQLFRCNFLPEVWIPDQTIRLLREMCAHCAALTADQTRIKNRIQSLLAQRLIPVPLHVLFVSNTAGAFASRAARRGWPFLSANRSVPKSATRASRLRDHHRARLAAVPAPLRPNAGSLV